MVYRSEMGSGSEGSKEFRPETDGKDFISIRNQNLWGSIELHNLIQELLGYLCSCEGVLERNQVAKLGIFVNYYHNSIVAMGFR